MKKVVARYRWTAIVKNNNNLYDMYEWSLWKMKWVKIASACHFGALKDASNAANLRSNEIDRMFRNNTSPPQPLG